MTHADRSPNAPLPLAQISTVWSVVLKAKDGAGVSVEVVTSFFARYQSAVYRYFLTSLNRPDVAEDLTQDFALRFVRGDFSKIHPDRGRFRDFLRVALANQLRDYYRRQKLREGCEIGEADPVDSKSDDDTTTTFDETWRMELLSQTWSALEQHQQATGQMYFAALKLKATESSRSSAELAEIYSRQVSVSTSDEAFRKTLQRARHRFAELLLQAVAETLAIPTRDELECELIELKLLSYCGSLLRQSG